MKSQFINSALLFVLSASLIYSCKSEKQNSHELLDTATFYMQVSGNLMGKSTDEQDFISVINSELQALKNDSNAKVDVNPLNIELKEAVAYCQDRIKSINASKEVDPAIGLKAKTLKHFELYLDILRQEMSTALGIMASNSTNRFETISVLLKPKLTQLSESIAEVKSADGKFRSQYHIK